MWGLPTAELSPLPSLGHQSTPSPLEGLQGVGSVEAHVTNRRIVHSSSRHLRHLKEELELGQMWQSRVQGPLLQPRKEATGSGVSGLKQSSCGFQRHIRRELVLMPFGPGLEWQGKSVTTMVYLHFNLGTQSKPCILGTNVAIPLGLMVQLVQARS